MDCFSESTQIILNVVLLSQSSVQFAYQYMDLNGIVNETLSAKWHGLGREVWPDTDIFLRCLQIIQKLYTIASSQCSCPINTTESVWDRDKVRCKGQFDADTANPPDAANIEYKRKSETNFEALRVQTRSNPSPHNLENSSSETSDTERIHRSVQKKRVYQIPMDQAQEDIDAVIIFGQSHYQHSNSLSMLRGLQKGTVDIRSKTETVDKMKCNIYFECYRLTTSSLSKLKIINGLKQISNERVLVSGHPNVRSEIENVAKEANSAAEVAEQINDKITSGQPSPDEYGSQKHKNRADASEEPRSHEDIHSEFRYEGVDLQQYEDKKVGLRQSRNKLHDVPLKNETNVEEQLNGEDTHCGQPIEELHDVPLQNETNVEEQLTDKDTHCVQPIEELHDVPLQNETNVEEQLTDKDTHCGQPIEELDDVPLQNETNTEEQLNGEDTHCGQPIEELHDVPLQNETNIEEQLNGEDTHCGQPIEELHDVPLQNETNVEEQLNDKDTHCGQPIEELHDVPLQNETNVEEQLTDKDTHCGQPIEELDDVPLQNETNIEEQLNGEDTHCGQPIEELHDVPLQNETNIEEQLNGEDTHCGQSIEELDDVPLQNETNIEEQLTEEEAHCDIRQLGAGSNRGLQETSTGTRGSRERPRNINAAEVKPVMVEAASVAISSSNKHTTDIDKLQPTTKSLMNTIIGKRHLVTYHVSRHRGLPLNWMKYEVLRLCSFGRFRNFENLGQWPTRLAQIGFYFVESDGTAITRCYSCAKEYQNLQNMSLEHAHEPACNWEDTNISIKDSLRGFSNEELEKYMIEYGSGLSRKPEEGHAGSTVGLAELSEYGDGVEDDCGSDPIRQPSAAGLMDGSSTDGMFGRGRRSLPENLNELSGSVVAEESPQTVATSQAFLTSASEKPMSLPDEEVDNVDIEGASSEGAEARLPRFDLRQASYPQFASSYSRSQTYGSWSRDHPKRPEHLSDAGFFFAGKFCFNGAV